MGEGDGVEVLRELFDLLCKLAQGRSDGLALLGDLYGRQHVSTGTVVWWSCIRTWYFWPSRCIVPLMSEGLEKQGGLEQKKHSSAGGPYRESYGCCLLFTLEIKFDFIFETQLSDFERSPALASPTPTRRRGARAQSARVKKRSDRERTSGALAWSTISHRPRPPRGPLQTRRHRPRTPSRHTTYPSRARRHPRPRPRTGLPRWPPMARATRSTPVSPRGLRALLALRTVNLITRAPRSQARCFSQTCPARPPRSRPASSARPSPSLRPARAPCPTAGSRPARPRQTATRRLHDSSPRNHSNHSRTTPRPSSKHDPVLRFPTRC